MTTPVTFEIAKLLKEKGFEQTLQVGIICRIQNKVNKDYEKIRPLKESDLKNDWSIFNEIYPTIAEVVMWFYEKHGIWVGVQPNEPYVDDDWCFTIFKDLKNNNSLEGYNSPTEAYEAGIEYTLKNLI